MEPLTILAIALLVGSVIANVAFNLAASELYDWAPRLADWLIDRAVAKLREPAHRADYGEQFRADLADVPGHLAKVWFAFRTYLGRNRLARNVRGEQVREVDMAVLRQAGRWSAAAFFLMATGDLVERVWPHHPIAQHVTGFMLWNSTIAMLYVLLLRRNLYKSAKKD